MRGCFIAETGSHVWPVLSLDPCEGDRDGEKEWTMALTGRGFLACAAQRPRITRRARRVAGNLPAAAGPCHPATMARPRRGWCYATPYVPASAVHAPTTGEYDGEASGYTGDLRADLHCEGALEWAGDGVVVIEVWRDHGWRTDSTSISSLRDILRSSAPQRPPTMAADSSLTSCV